MTMMKHINLYAFCIQHHTSTTTARLHRTTQVARMHSSAIQILHFSFEMSKINTKIWLICCDLLHKNFNVAYFGKELPLGVVHACYFTCVRIKYSKICFCPLLKLMDSCIYISMFQYFSMCTDTKCIIFYYFTAEDNAHCTQPTQFEKLRFSHTFGKLGVQPNRPYKT